jgi:hypothetical protein
VIYELVFRTKIDGDVVQVLPDDVTLFATGSLDDIYSRMMRVKHQCEFNGYKAVDHRYRRMNGHPILAAFSVIRSNGEWQAGYAIRKAIKYMKVNRTADCSANLGLLRSGTA